MAAPLEHDLVVQHLLTQHGLGEIRNGTETALPGRNAVWLVETTLGTVFVKRLRGRPEEVAERMARLSSFGRASAALTSAGVNFPAVVALDESEAVVLTEGLLDVRNVGEAVSEDQAEEWWPAAIGDTLGRLHHADLGGIRDHLDTSLPHMPDLAALVALPVHALDSLTNGELEAWSLLHADGELLSAVADLLAAEQLAPRTPVHGDVRLDQFLARDGSLWLCDWEEFRLADPARDVGACIGQWLYHALSGILRIDAALMGSTLSPEQLMGSGHDRIMACRPALVGFWSSYRSHGTQDDTGLDRRALAWAGWHLIDRMVAAAARSPKVSGIDRAAAGIGRSMLLAPERFTRALGLAA